MEVIEILIEKYKYKKVIDEEFKFKIPTEPIYLFQFGKRISIKVIPIWTTWNKE